MSGYYVHNPNVHKHAGGLSGFGEQGQGFHSIVDSQYGSKNQPQGRNKDQKKGTTNTTTADTPVYFWNLNDETSTQDPPSYSQSMPSVHDGDKNKVESVVNAVDGRTPVDLDDYQAADGKYRGELKSLRRRELYSNVWLSHRQALSPLRRADR